jgi:DNA-directed RNA polymerase specialized sigma24 family protein
MADEAEADELAEETQQVIEALKQVTKIEDPVARAAAISEVLAYVDEHAPEWRENRREVVLDLRSKEVSYRRIAKMIKVSLGTVQSIERGHAGAWGTKPRTKAKPEPDDG